jgi:hypothetical protein
MFHRPAPVSIILLTPSADHELRVLRHEGAWRAARAAITPLNIMTSAAYERAITDLMPRGEPMNVAKTESVIWLGARPRRTLRRSRRVVVFSLAEDQPGARARACFEIGGEE